MKKFVGEFVYRGLLACGFGPMIWAVIIGMLSQKYDVFQTVPATEVVLGVLTSALLAFVAGGINAIYKIERIPLILAIFVHAAVLYLDYIVIYLWNGWMKAEFTVLMVFTVCFFTGFALIWALIYFYTKKSTDRLNRQLAEFQKKVEKSEV